MVRCSECGGQMLQDARIDICENAAKDDPTCENATYYPSAF